MAEALIFNNFGSKSKLFHASIFKPLNDHLAEFYSTHMTDAPQDREIREQGTREYIEELERFIDKHSRKFLSLFFEQTYGHTDHGLDEIEGIQEYLSFAASISRNHGTNKAPRIPAHIMARLSFGAIFSCVIFREWLFPAGVASKQEIFSSLTDFVIDGLNANSKPRG